MWILGLVMVMLLVMGLGLLHQWWKTRRLLRMQRTPEAVLEGNSLGIAGIVKNSYIDEDGTRVITSFEVTEVSLVPPARFMR
jgi:hypothetical protein